MRNDLALAKLILILALAALVAALANGTPILAAEEVEIDVDPARGPVGTEVDIDGDDFPAETAVVLCFKTKDNKVAETETDERGRFRASFEVTEYPVGVYCVWALSAGAEGSSQFIVTPSIDVDTLSGSVGSNVTVSGTGFAAETSFSLYCASKKVDTGETDENGSFAERRFQVPAVPAGEQVIKVQDADKNADSARFTVHPSIQFSPVSGPAGSRVALRGDGFKAEDTLSIYFGNDKVAEAETDKEGSFADASFHIPHSCHGAHQVTAEDSNGNTASSSFSIHASIALKPTTRPVGSKIEITGTGFETNSHIVTVFDGERVGTYPSDDYGNFSGTFTVPAHPTGHYHNIQATDGSNKGSTEFTILAGASINPTEGHVGSRV